MPSFSGVTLALGRGLMADRCQRTSLTEGDAFAAGVDVKAWGKWGMQQWGFDERPGSGVWGRHLDMGLGLGMQNMLGWSCGGKQYCTGGVG